MRCDPFTAPCLPIVHGVVDVLITPEGSTKGSLDPPFHSPFGTMHVGACLGGFPRLRAATYVWVCNCARPHCSGRSTPGVLLHPPTSTPPPPPFLALFLILYPLPLLLLPCFVSRLTFSDSFRSGRAECRLCAACACAGVCVCFAVV